jgi:hypothetical protein
MAEYQQLGPVERDAGEVREHLGPAQVVLG